MKINAMLNTIRNLLNFGIRYPWVKYGKNVHCQMNTRIWSPNKIFILGDNVGIGVRCIFQVDCIIGNDVLIASHVALVGRDAHTTQAIGCSMFESPRGDKYQIIIEDDVWIGFGAIILSGVRVGRGSIVAAGAVVTRDVEPYTIVASRKAEEIGKRFSADQIVEHDRIMSERDKWSSHTTFDG